MHYSRKIDPGNPYATLEWGVLEQHVTVGGKNRRFLTYIPDGARAGASGVFILGPDNRTAEDLLQNSGWRELADGERSGGGLILFFLEPENGRWNAEEPYGAKDGDAAYVNAVFAKGCECLHYSIHESKNYLYGEEEGGRAAQMAAMAEPALYAGLVTVGAGDAASAYCAACEKDACRNLDGFSDLEARKGIRKGDIPLPVWIIDDPERGKAEHMLAYWIHANGADAAGREIDGGVVEYVRAAETEYPLNQDKRVCRVWRSQRTVRDGGPAFVREIWEKFLSRHRRWMADPGGSLRLARDPVRDVGMEYHFEEIGGWMREWHIYVPESVRKTPEKKVPLVLALHGYSCTGAIYAGNTDWDRVARERGFILVFPTAIPGPLGFQMDAFAPENLPAPSWNFLHRPNGPDEFLFFRELLRRVSGAYPVDPARVYVTGHSQGAMMSHALALGMPNLFAAAAPCSGVIIAPVHEDFVALPELRGDGPVPIWMFAGQEEQWLIDAEPRMDNATGKTIALWHSRNRLPGKAEDRFQNCWNRHNGRWLDLCYENSDGQPVLRYTQVEYFPHATMPEMSWRIWDEFFAHWSRTEEGPKRNEVFLNL